MAAAVAASERPCNGTTGVFSGDGHGSRRRWADAKLFPMKLLGMVSWGAYATKRRSPLQAGGGTSFAGELL
jgi:hypothetical protein